MTIAPTMPIIGSSQFQPYSFPENRAIIASIEVIKLLGLVPVLASDSHNLRGRRPVLSEALNAMVPIVGERRASAMCHEGPRALLEGREPVLPEVESDTD